MRREVVQADAEGTRKPPQKVGGGLLLCGRLFAEVDCEAYIAGKDIGKGYGIGEC